MMRNWKIAVRFLTTCLFAFASPASYSWAQTPAKTIQQPAQPATAPAAGQRPLPAANAGQPNPIGAAAPNPPAPAPLGQAPFPPLAPAYQKYLDDVLAAWEKSTSGIERYQCKFSRWQYNPEATKDPAVFETASSGTIRYMAPDKGMFKVEELKIHKQKPDGSWGYEVVPGQFGEWWICDGENVHLYDQTQKRAKKYLLPPNMRGAEVFNSPLPFVFGVKAQKVNARFWVQPLAPPPLPDGKPNPDIILLDAYPKFQADAVNYHHVSIYLDRKEFLPIGIMIYLPNWTPQAEHKEVFEFHDREVNSSLLAKFTETVFRQNFIPMEPPKGWTVEEIPFVPDEDAQRVAAPAGQQQNPLPR